MGARNPDRFSPAEWRETYENIGQMRQRRWRVQTVCELCGLKLSFNLAAAVRSATPSYSLWNARHPCRRVAGFETRCTGLVRYEARPPHCSRYFTLDAPDPPGRVIANAP